jgi:4-alpha-glucanotransferase
MSEIDRVRFSQFLLSRQIKRLKEYANNKGVRLIGDSPFFISADSSEAWAYPELFVRDEKLAQGAAGDLVPFCFSSGDGLGRDSDRAALSRVSYRWCADRLRGLLTQVDAARVDVRALAAPRHTTGGTRADLGGECDGDCNLDAAKGLVGDAFELNRAGGFAFRDRSYVPETRPLQFAFDGRSDKTSIAQAGTRDSMVYTGLPDGVSVRAWFNELSDDCRRDLWAYLERPVGESEVGPELIRLAWSSSAALAMVPLPDLLSLERDPASMGDVNDGHRRWRCTKEMLSAPALYWLRELTRISNRCSAERQETPSPAKRRTSRIPPRIEVAL